jgi:hypothetical protein
MNDDYIEKNTPMGFILRVNSKKNTYMIFRDNESLKNPRSRTQSIIHELPQVVFLGKEFEIRMSASERIGFFEVINGQIYIPFWVKGMSDVRHVKLPAYIDCDYLPVYLYQFQVFHVGSIPIFASSLNYFVVESRIDRELLVRLKMNFPTSRIIIYKGEKDSILPDDLSNVNRSANSDNTRATDLVESEDKSYIDTNPSFAARIYLRRLHFEKVSEIPEIYDLSLNDLEVILGYLRVMRKKASDQNDLKVNLKKIDELIELFIFLTPMFTLEIRQVEKLFDEGIPSQFLLRKMKKILKSQTEICRAVSNEKKLLFFQNVLSMVKPLILDE